MTDLPTQGPGFQGVDISTLMNVIIAIMAFTASTSTSALPDVTREQKSLGTEDNALMTPYCVYLEGSQEMDCLCPDQGQTKATSGPPMLFPDAGFILNTKNESSIVASVKLHSCQEVNLRVDLTSMERPFYRLRIEDAQRVTIDSIKLLPNDTVDLWFRNINESLSITGAFECKGCKGQNKAILNLHLLDNSDVTLEDVVIDDEVKARFKFRNADRILIRDSYFKSMYKDSIEIFNVPSVSISHSEFHDTAQSAILLNRVENLTVSDCLVEREAVEALTEDTLIEWTCTISPLASPSEVMSEEELLKCSVEGRLLGTASEDSSTSAESAGAIVLAVVSGTILLVAVTVLIVLQRNGKLDQYL